MANDYTKYYMRSRLQHVLRDSLREAYEILAEGEWAAKTISIFNTFFSLLK